MCRACPSMEGSTVLGGFAFLEMFSLLSHLEYFSNQDFRRGFVIAVFNFKVKFWTEMPKAWIMLVLF